MQVNTQVCSIAIWTSNCSITFVEDIFSFRFLKRSLGYMLVAVLPVFPICPSDVCISILLPMLHSLIYCSFTRCLESKLCNSYHFFLLSDWILKIFVGFMLNFCFCLHFILYCSFCLSKLFLIFPNCPLINLKELRWCRFLIQVLEIHVLFSLFVSISLYFPLSLFSLNLSLSFVLCYFVAVVAFDLSWNYWFDSSLLVS